jgi:hypothetical protein
MKRINLISIALVLLAVTACKDQLDVQNPNSPTPASAKTERGIIGFAQGGVYVNGFYDLKFYDGVPGRFWTGAIGFHDIMGDEIGEEAANVYGNQIGCPENVVLDNGSSVPNPQSPKKQHDLLRLVNVNAQQGNNPLFYEWAYMYAMNNAMNVTLSLIDGVSFTTDGPTKAAVVKAWAYFWKGYAYSRIGSLYYAGIINDEPYKSNGNYVDRNAILAEAEKNFAAAEAQLNGLTADDAYSSTLGAMIPDICQVGKGGILAPDAWVRTINTMRARNILVNTTTAAMTSAQWDQILTLTTNGVKATDKVFTLRSNANGDLMSASSGNIPAKTYGSTPQGGTYKVSERLIQDYNVGDKRKDNNFKEFALAPWIGNADRGNIFNTRYALLDGGAGMPGVVVLCDRSEGGYELYLAGTWEENELMMAEANINKASPNLTAAAASIDLVRTAQGAGLAPIGSVTAPVAKEELRKERRVALAFRGLSFYDARRWEVITNGRTGCVVVDGAGTVNNNATIQYNFLDYWDVPDNELAYNAPADGSAPVKNPIP